MKKERKILLICLLMCLATLATTFWFSVSNQRKIIVVDAVRLFNSYSMKGELENIAKRQLQAEGALMDSLNKALQMARAMNSDEEQAKQLTYKAEQMKAKLQNDYEQSNHDINEKVWKRLNPLLDEYGKKNGLHLIVGANGMGNVLYNDASYDCTNDVIKFVNKKYAEGI